MILAAIMGAGAFAVVMLLDHVRRSRRLRRSAVLLAMPVALVGALAGAANATSSTAQAMVYRTTWQCSHAGVTGNNTGDPGRFDVNAAGQYWNSTPDYGYGPNTDCGISESEAAFQLETREDIYWYSASAGKYVICNTGPWVKNTQTAHQVNTGWSATPCGVGYYFASGAGAIYNASWLGGWTQMPNAVYVN